MIHETHTAFSRSLQLADAGGVQIVIHPLDHKPRRVLCELGGSRKAETRLQQGDGLDEHVIVSEQFFAALEQRLQPPNRRVMVGIGGVRPGVDGRRVQEYHFSNAVASASSCASDTGDSRPCFDRPARTDAN